RRYRDVFLTFCNLTAWKRFSPERRGSIRRGPTSSTETCDIRSREPTLCALNEKLRACRIFWPIRAHQKHDQDDQQERLGLAAALAPRVDDVELLAERAEAADGSVLMELHDPR